MQSINPMWFAAFYGLSEIAISTFLRSGDKSRSSDKGSLRKIWMVINVCMVGSLLAYYLIPTASFRGSEALAWCGFGIYVFGLALRWYSISYLGRFFTVDVTVVADQKVIDTGPYRFIRHPSYTGSLLAFVGLALLIGNYVSAFLIVVPVFAVFTLRMNVEEAALSSGLGDRYREYMKRTRRLIPFVY